jgi:hypothetical protein
VLLLALTACSAEPTGSVQLAASVQQALTANDVTRVKVTASGSDMAPLVVELAKSNGAWGGLIGNIPAGANRSFLAEAFDSAGTLRFQGQASGITITANQTTAVALTLQESVPLTPYTNEVPLVESLVASVSTVQTGGSLTLTTVVRDPNPGDTLTLAWTATGGTFSAPTAATTSWTAPSTAGLKTLTLTVTDSQGAALSVNLSINVVSGASTGNAALNISFNLWPVVSKVSASASRLDAGQSTTLTAQASDADGDALSYQWTSSSSCPGTWTNATASEASFVPASRPASACNNCQLTVTVQDGRGGQTTGLFNLCVTSTTPEALPPLITNSYQSATASSAGQTVAFDVTALDPQSSTLTFIWRPNVGSLATAQSASTTSRVVWTAPPCTPAGVTPSVTATVTNAYGRSVSKAFSISGVATCTASRWAAVAPITSVRSYHTATLLDSGKVFVAGGMTGSSTYTATTEVYDPATNTWTSTAPMATARHAHTATRLASGKVLIVGGSNGSALAAPVLYDPATNTWSSAGTLATARYSHAAVLLTSGKVLVAGGFSGGSAVASAEVYDPATNAWSTVAPMASARGDHTATRLVSGKVLVAGGSNASGQLGAAEVYDPAANTWSPAGGLSTPLSLHSAVLLSSGKVLVVGGWYDIIRPYAQLYDPATNSWASTTYMLTSRTRPTATLLPSGKVLVAGGDNPYGYTSSTEIYDPNAASWTAAGSMTVGRYSHTATQFLSGQVLVLGGGSGADLYTP